MQRKSEALKLESVPRRTGAHSAGLKAGDRLVFINGRPIRDPVDFQFHSADELLDCVFRRGNRPVHVRIRRDELDDFGLRFTPMRFRACGNRCVFCFADQNPKGLRNTLYFKDEDYRLSFLYGNYVTLTRVEEKDLLRIAEQRLSPLYVSVHATDAEVRKKLLGIRRDDRLLEKIRFLAVNGVEMHAQIVLCPGINDGTVLIETLESLFSFYPKLRSAAVVPVGLTRHRTGLPKIRPVDGPAASEVLRTVQPMQKRFQNQVREPFVYLADEWYFLAGKPVPPSVHYGGFWQRDNGVGMVRFFLTEFQKAKRRFLKRFDRPSRFVVVTGTLAGPVLRSQALPVLNQIGNAQFEMVEVQNRFFGESVTVSGLLTGRDIAAALRNVRGDWTGILPSNCLNSDGLFLDDWTVERLSKTLGRKILVLESFDALWEAA